jgi:hypothetical protein
MNLGSKNPMRLQLHMAASFITVKLYDPIHEAITQRPHLPLCHYLGEQGFSVEIWEGTD